MNDETEMELAELKLQAANGDTAAMEELSEVYAEDDSLDRALEYAVLAKNSGSARAAELLADIANRHYEAEQYANALTIAKCAAEGGSDEGYDLLSIMYGNGQGVPEDPVKEEEYGAKADEIRHAKNRKHLEKKFANNPAKLQKAIEKAEKDAEKSAQKHAKRLELIKRLETDDE